jgi:hypothetical protein
MDPVNVATSGINALVGSTNIAISALSVIAFFEAALIFYLLRGLFNFQEVLRDLAQTIAVLNERINRHD